MAESKRPLQVSDGKLEETRLSQKADKVIEEAVSQNNEFIDHRRKETHGMRNDIDENTPLDDVKAPNVFERAKEEFEALIQTIHPKKESAEDGKGDVSLIKEAKEDKKESLSDDKTPDFIKKAKEEIKGIMHHKKSPRHHHKETHGTSNEIDEETPINEVKGPNVFERAKEEIEALIQTIHPKKDG